MLCEFHLNKAAWKLKTVSPKAQPQFSAAPAAQHLGRQVSTGNLPKAPSLPWLPRLPPHRTAGRGDRGPHSGGHIQHFHPTPCFTPSCRGQRRLHHTGRLWLGDRPAGARPSGEAVGGGGPTPTPPALTTRTEDGDRSAVLMPGVVPGHQTPLPSADPAASAPSTPSDPGLCVCF